MQGEYIFVVRNKTLVSQNHLCFKDVGTIVRCIPSYNNKINIIPVNGKFPSNLERWTIDKELIHFFLQPIDDNSKINIF